MLYASGQELGLSAICADETAARLVHVQQMVRVHQSARPGG
jgi:hypothetical protein